MPHPRHTPSIAQVMDDYFKGFLAGEKTLNEAGEEHYTYQGRAEFVANMREIMIREGIGELLPDGTINPEIDDNNLRDLRSARRLQLIWDTNIEAAKSYGQFKEGQDPAILDVYPCQRFIRVHPVITPRPYHETALDEVRRKDDTEFWLSLNLDFGVPWGPWGFGSGCDVEDVDREEAETLGIIKKNETVHPIEKEFNDQLEASVANLTHEKKTWLKQVLGDQVKIEGDNAIVIRPETKQPAKQPLPQKTTKQRIAQINRIAETVEKRCEINQKKLAQASSLEAVNYIWHKIYRDNMRYLHTQGMIIPPSIRGKIEPHSVTYTGFRFEKMKSQKKLTPSVQHGIDIICAIVAKDKIPMSLGISMTKSYSRAFHSAGNIKVSISEKSSTVAHEIAHAIEYNNPAVLERSALFLHRRGAGQPAKKLLSLFPYSEYKQHEITLEDNFEKMGGKAYSGKIYSTTYKDNMNKDEFVKSIKGTEILSMGIQRMLESPVEFKRNDPEYFNFIKTQIQ